MDTVYTASQAGENAYFSSLEQGEESEEELYSDIDLLVFRVEPTGFRKGLACFNLVNTMNEIFLEKKDVLVNALDFELEMAHSIEVLRPGSLITRKLLSVAKYTELSMMSAEAFFKKYYELEFDDFEALTEEFFSSLKDKPMLQCVYKVIKILYAFQYDPPNYGELTDDQLFALIFFVMHVEAIKEYNGQVEFMQSKLKTEHKIPLRVKTTKIKGKSCGLSSPVFRKVSTNYMLVTGREGWRLQRI